MCVTEYYWILCCAGGNLQFARRFGVCGRRPGRSENWMMEWVRSGAMGSIAGETAVQQAAVVK